ncbi:MAG: putative flagellum biosynthesis repressor protein FlbT [Alphaproteobacteria bacterium]|nr:MAG: putative flagellum biosynthesis repressor protein FlbT [Alphaproteobacteria bacterium]
MGNIRLYIRPNEKLYINGAVIRFDRKVSIELLNDVTFLMENHVMQAEEASTPLRQLYFVVQMLLMDPANTEAPLKLFDGMVESLLDVLDNETLRNGVAAAQSEVRSGKVFGALKVLRELFRIEEGVLSGPPGELAPLPAAGAALDQAMAKQMGA